MLSGTRLHILNLQCVLAVEAMRNGSLLVKRVENLVRVLYTNKSNKAKVVVKKPLPID